MKMHGNELTKLVTRLEGGAPLPTALYRRTGNARILGSTGSSTIYAARTKPSR